MRKKVGAVAAAIEAITKAGSRSVLAAERRTAWPKDADADVAVFSYERDFASLWGLDREDGGLEGVAATLIASRKDKEYTLVVVWDGTPSLAGDVIAAGRYVTPYEWAAALTLALYRTRQKDAAVLEPKLRFLILDLASHEIGQGFVQRSLYALQNLLPWIQDYHLIAAGPAFLAEDAMDPKDCDTYALLRQVLPPARRDTQRFIHDLLRPACVLTTFADNLDRSALLENVVEAWRQQFLKAGDRHSVANLVAPFALAAGLPRKVSRAARELIEADSVPRRALWILLQELGLLKRPPESIRTQTAAILGNGSGIFGRRIGVRVLLVDDQYRLGFQHIVGYALFGKHYKPTEGRGDEASWKYAKEAEGELRCEAGAELIFDALGNLGLIQDWMLPRCASVPAADILLLDLRLWLEGETDRRQKFMDTLVRLCEQLNSEGISDPAFCRAYDAAKTLAGGGETSELPALALLPLLLTHLDPSLPIVLFSSTHQREVIELLAHRPSIITSFSKPLLSGYGESPDPESMFAALRAALRRALDLHEARLVWERIVRADWNGWPSFSANVPSEGTAQVEPVEFNTPPDDRIHAPRLQGNDLRKQLARFYVEYVLPQSYYDFASVPYEFIEGALTPTEAQRLPTTGFKILDNDNSESRNRNKVARALQNLRNRKAHGHAKRPRPADATDTEWWRRGSLLVFILLLDYIESQSVKRPGVEEDLRRIFAEAWKRLRRKFGRDLGSLLHDRYPPRANELSSLPEIPWHYYLHYCIAVALRNSCADNTVRASEAAIEALLRFGDLLARLPDPQR